MQEIIPMSPTETAPTFYDFLVSLDNVGAATAQKVVDRYDSPADVAALDVDELEREAGIPLPQAVAILRGIAELSPPIPDDSNGEDEGEGPNLPPTAIISHTEAETAHSFSSKGKDFMRPIAQLRKEARDRAKAKRAAARLTPPTHITYKVQIDPYSAITRRKLITPAVCTKCAFDYCEAQRPPLPPYEELDEQTQGLVRTAMKKHRSLHEDEDDIPTIKIALTATG